MTRPRIAVYTIAKNEAKHVARWAATTDGADHRLVVVDAATDDNTLALLREHHIDNVQVDYGEMGGFRFDTARNFALSHLPDDIDLCVSLDMDELLDPGFIDGLRDLWQRLGPFHKAHPWFNTGTWWRADRVHSRHGWVWRWPCHELTDWIGNPNEGPRHVDYEGTMRHAPDDSKKRSNYLPLLRLGVQEEPDNGRMWTYLARQLWFEGGDYAETAEAIDRSLELGLSVAEQAFMYRIRASIEAAEWLRRGTATNEPEAWYAYANQQFSADHYAEAAEAAIKAHNPPPAQHYLTDHAVRSYGAADLAARSYWALRQVDDAVTWGTAAWLGNPLDGRLVANLREYVQAQGIATWAIVPVAPGWRDNAERFGITTALLDALTQQGVRVIIDDTDRDLTAKWNARLGQIAETAHGEGRDRWNVLVINDDVRLGNGAILGLSAALRAGDDVGAACPDGEAFAGWCHMLRGEQGYRYDEQLRWWYADTDLHRRLRADGLVVANVPVSAQHMHPNESTVTDPARLALAREDEARYAAKWGDDPDSLFLAQNPKWAMALGGIINEEAAAGLRLVGE